MGNGPRVISIDTETSGLNDDSSGVLTVDTIEKAMLAAAANFGRPNLIFMGAPFVSTWEANPEFTGTPWADTARMTKRERAVAGLHTTLNKLGVLKKISEDDFEAIRNKTIRRLKKAKWAQYNRKKVQSTP